MAGKESLRQSMLMTPEHYAELTELFHSIDESGNGYIEFDELQKALSICGVKKAPYEIRILIEEKFKAFDTNKDDRLSIEEFQNLYSHLKSQEVSSSFKLQVSKAADVTAYGGMTEVSVEGTTHSVSNHERIAFSSWINSNLSDDADCAKYLPFNPESNDLYTKIKDGIILCKIVNKVAPGTIDERVINKKGLNIYRQRENLTLALMSAESIGCTLINIRPHDLEEAKPHLVLGIVWQLLKVGLLSEINLVSNPHLAALLREGEDLAELQKLSPEQLLVRWLNFQLERAGIDRRIENFSADIKDSEAYCHLLNQIAPRDPEHELLQKYGPVTLHPLSENDLLKRAELMLSEAAKMDCCEFVTASEVVAGNPKLNMAFVANLFNKFPGLEDTDAPVLEIVEETREEKTYRNWMNSLGLRRHINNLYFDLPASTVIFELYDIIRPGLVNWSRVKTVFKKIRINFEKLENCNYAVEVGKQCNFSLVGIGGQDILDGNRTLTLALLWQLMRAYTLRNLSLLTDSGHPAVESEVVAWAIGKLKNAEKSSKFSSFQDSSLSDGLVIIDLIDAIVPGSVNYNLVKAGNNEEERSANAHYAVSMGRKIGARIYALPEDIIEVKPKMLMTLFACLMIKDLQPQMRRESVTAN